MHKKATSIRPHFGDEHVVAVDPPIRPNTGEFWRRRMHAFAHRALSDKALSAEQLSNAGMQRLRGQSVSHGVISDMEVWPSIGSMGKQPHEARLEINNGMALARSGEDVTIPAPRALTIDSLPVIAPVNLGDDTSAEAEILPAEEDDTFALGLRPEAPRQHYTSFKSLAKQDKVDDLPRVAILVAEPVTVTALDNLADPDCPPDPRNDAYDDLQYIDGTRLCLYFWPAEMLGMGGTLGYDLPARSNQWRNMLAQRVFEVEQSFGTGHTHPWEHHGVALAMIGFTQDWKLDFVDSGSVVRKGGLPKPRTSLTDQAVSPFLAQARVSQFSEHLLTLEDVTPTHLAQSFAFLPPVGLLPADVIDTVTRRQTFFPPGFDIRLAPIPLEQIDLVVAESAGLDTIDLSVPDQIEMLLAVPARVYDPQLLETAKVSPEFQNAINRFTADRSDWLSRREAVRRRVDALALNCDGKYSGWAVTDSPEDELAVDHTQIAPLSAASAIKMPVASGQTAAKIEDLPAPFTLGEGDSFAMWVRLPKSQTPKAISVGMVRAASAGPKMGFGHCLGDRSKISDFSSGVFLEDAINPQLPDGGQWTKIVIPSHAISSKKLSGREPMSVAGNPITEIVLVHSNGSIEWGPVSTISSAGDERILFDGRFPDGAKLKIPDGAALEPAIAPDEGQYGVLEVAGQLRVAEKSSFKHRWRQPYLQAHMTTLDRYGFSYLIEQLDKRLQTTNDAIDLGFVRARSDIYRLREFILGRDEASKLVTSPALADLSVRDESARATGMDLAKFLEKSHVTLADTTLSDLQIKTLISAVTAGDGDSGGGSGGGSAKPAGTTGSFNFGGGSLTSVESSMVTMGMSSASSLPMMLMLGGGAAKPEPAKPKDAQPLMLHAFPGAKDEVKPYGGIYSGSHYGKPAPKETSVKIPQYKVAADYSYALKPSFASVRAGLYAKDIDRKDILLDRPMPAYVDRTVSVARRLKEPPSKKAYEYAIAGKLAVVNTIGGLISESETDGRPRGIMLADLPTPGFRFSGDEAAAKAAGRALFTIGDLIAHEDEYIDDADIAVEDTGRHESEYFSAAVHAIDNAIAIMRFVEGRVDLYNKFLADAKRAHGAIMDLVRDAEQRLHTIGIELEEARHDVNVAQALLAEAQQDADETNARRANVMRDFGQSVLYRRPRMAIRSERVESSQALDALMPDPVVSCLTNHEDQPEEVQQFVALFQDAPVGWFPQVARQLRRINRLPMARAALLAVQARANSHQAWTVAQKQPANRGLRAVASAMQAHLQRLERRRALVRRFDFGAAARYNLLQIQREMQKISSLGDLVEAARSRPALAKQVSQLLDNIGNIAACLNDRFGEVAPAIRMDWAEMLSAHDDPVPLSTLSGLPQWAEIPIEQRRELQNLVDWLFAQINPSEQDAIDAMNELVRICLLMAAHSPVDQLIPGTLVSSIPAKVGQLIPLKIDISQIRTGLGGLIRSANGQRLALAKIEEIGPDFAHARITRSYTTAKTLDAGLRVDFGGMIIGRGV